MVTQIVSVVAALLDHRWYQWNFGGFIVSVHLIAVMAIYFMAAVSIISAVDYFNAFWSKIDHASSAARRRKSAVLSKGRDVLGRTKRTAPGGEPASPIKAE
jgi:CDP-diacylglycerol--glycerol-3-phosphate 3-phosphatidyltransferase